VPRARQVVAPQNRIRGRCDRSCPQTPVYKGQGPSAGSARKSRKSPSALMVEELASRMAFAPRPFASSGLGSARTLVLPSRRLDVCRVVEGSSGLDAVRQQGIAQTVT
jgi:hypothetical protein